MKDVPGGPAAFPTTVWADLLLLADPTHPAYAGVLDGLARRYWRPVYAYLRAAGRLSGDDAADLTQAFFAYLLQKRYLQRLQPDRGTFRGYLKRSVKHFLINAKRAQAVRNRATPTFSLDASPTELERLAAYDSPDEAYDREWFRTLMHDAHAELARELTASGHADYLRVFERYRQRAEAEAPSTYRELADELGLTEGDVRNYLSRTRALLRDVLRRQIRRYATSEEEVEAELREIMRR